MLKSLFIFAVLAGSWNLKWFPSGRAEHRASPRVEAANIADAAEVIRANLKGRGRVMFLQEMRDAQACTNLAKAVGDADLKVAVASAFRDFRDNRLQWQQLGILTDLPVIEAKWKYSKKAGGLFVPRGYAYALLDGGAEGRIACFCVHLKSNYGARKAAKKKENMLKREACIRQVLEAAKGCKADRILIAGDFNSDRFQKAFADEKIFAIMESAGFKDGWAGAEMSVRGTHPGNTRYPDSTLDYVFYKGYCGCTSRSLAPVVPVSDHRMLVMDFEWSGRCD
jgi:endonuclease/exonuclease/phosphatase family metal-dependent hydrolase